MKHYVWYNAQDSYFYENDHDYFSGFAINAHTLAHNSKAFLALEFMTGKPFFILPDIHAIQFYSSQLFDNKKGGTRISWEKLRRFYPDIVTRTLSEKRSLSPTDFSEQGLLDFAQGILDFQSRALVEPFRSLSRLVPGAQVPRPEFLVAPYFFFQNTRDPWLALSMRASASAAALKGTNRVFGVIACSSDCLDLTELAVIDSSFTHLSLDGFLIWIDDFDEADASEEQLNGLIELVRRLSSTGKPVINLYGGYFSILLKYFGLEGFGSGICTRDSMPVHPQVQGGGPAGGPIPRYYIPKLHKKLVQEDARRLIGQVPSLTCSCEICANRSLLTMPNVTGDQHSNLRRLMREHFLRVRRNQITQVDSESPQQAVNAIKEATAEIAGASATLFDSTFLGRWSHALSRNLL